MKIQLGSVDEFENIFKELAGGENSTNNEEESEVIMFIKDIFLRNAEICGKELSLGEVVQERIDKKRPSPQILARIEESERQRLEKLTDLCAVRRELPVLLREELEKEYSKVTEQIGDKEEGEKRAEEQEAEKEEQLGSISKIKTTVDELTKTLSSLVLQIKENNAHVEKEVKEQLEERGKQIEARSLSLLFKDELEIKRVA